MTLVDRLLFTTHDRARHSVYGPKLKYTPTGEGTKSDRPFVPEVVLPYRVLIQALSFGIDDGLPSNQSSEPPLAYRPTSRSMAITIVPGISTSLTGWKGWIRSAATRRCQHSPRLPDVGVNRVLSDDVACAPSLRGVLGQVVMARRETPELHSRACCPRISEAFHQPRYKGAQPLTFAKSAFGSGEIRNRRPGRARRGGIRWCPQLLTERVAVAPDSALSQSRTEKSRWPRSDQLAERARDLRVSWVILGNFR